jgi:predicted esterase
MGNVHKGQPVATRGKPLDESRGVVVMMHGRGRDTDDILRVAERIGEEAFAYLAPAAEDNSWYPYSFMAPLEKNEPYLSHALEVYDDLVTWLVEKGIPKRRIVLAGFSQGACLTAEYAVRHADRYGGILLFTGGLIGPPGTSWEYEGSFDDTPVFLGTSDVDEFVPVERVHESATVFGNMGADVIVRVYRGLGHFVNDDEISLASEILQGVVSERQAWSLLHRLCRGRRVSWGGDRGCITYRDAERE